MEASTPPVEHPYGETPSRVFGLKPSEAIAIIAAGVVAGITAIICCIILCSKAMAKRTERLHRGKLRQIAIDTTLKMEELDRRAAEIHKQEEAEGMGGMMEEEFIDDAVIIGATGSKSPGPAFSRTAPSPSQMAPSRALLATQSFARGPPVTQSFAPMMPNPSVQAVQSAMMGGMVNPGVMIDPMMASMMGAGGMMSTGPMINPMMSGMIGSGPMVPMVGGPGMGVGSKMGIAPMASHHQTPQFQIASPDQRTLPSIPAGTARQPYPREHDVSTSVPEYQYEYYYAQAAADAQQASLRAQQHLQQQLQMQTNMRQRIVTPPSLPVIQAGEHYSYQT